MARGSEQAAVNTLQQNRATLAPQQAAALASENAAIGQYQTAINQLTATNPWEDPAYKQNVTKLAASIAHGAGPSQGQQMGEFSKTAGTNAGQAANILERGTRADQAKMTGALPAQEASDYDKYIGLKKFGVAALGKIPALLANNYKIATSGLTGAGQSYASLAHPDPTMLQVASAIGAMLGTGGKAIMPSSPGGGGMYDPNSASSQAYADYYNQQQAGFDPFTGATYT